MWLEVKSLDRVYVGVFGDKRVAMAELSIQGAAMRGFRGNEKELTVPLKWLSEDPISRAYWTSTYLQKMGPFE